MRKIKNKCVVYSDDLEVMNIFLDYMYRKKYLLNIFEKNDKISPYYGIILMSIDSGQINKIIKKKFKNCLILRWNYEKQCTQK